MEIKKVGAIVIVVLVLVAAGLVLYQQRQAVLSQKNQPQPSQSAVSVVDQKITDNTKPFKIDITYPQISGQDNFNKKVKDIIDQKIAEFKSNSLENDAAVKKADPVSYAKYPREYDLNINYKKGQIDENVASVVLEMYAFEGGAHGGTVFTPINWDVKNQKEIKLADLFPNDPNYLKTVSDFCIKDLGNQISTRMEDNGQFVKENQQWINDGAGPKADNYSTFLINKDSIVFYFAEYQVAPYAAGDFQVTYPRK